MSNDISNISLLSSIGGFFIVFGGMVHLLFELLCGIGICGAITNVNNVILADIGISIDIFYLESMTIIAGICIIVGSVIVQDSTAESMKKGGMIISVFSILCLFSFNPLCMIGAILGLIGGILCVTFPLELQHIQK